MFDIVQIINIFINNLVPILMIAAIGYWVGRRFDIHPKPVGSLIFYVFSPALVFYSLVTSEIGGEEFFTLFGMTVAFQVIMAGIAYSLLWMQGTSSLERAGVIIGSISLNAGNFGLALVSFAFGPEVMSRAVVVYVANTMMNYTFGVYIASNGRESPSVALRNVLKTPTIYAGAAALIFSGLQISLPISLLRTTQLMANAAIPMMLILLGLQLGQFVHMSKLRLVVTGVGLRLLLSPFVAAAMVLLVGLNSLAGTAFIIQASTPTAVLTIILATEFDLDSELALNLILASTLFSPLTLSILIFLLQ